MDKYKNKYRVQSHRMPGWDYSGNGYYFITLVTQNRDCNLGKIINMHGRAYMELSDFGKIVNAEWNKSFEMRNELFLDKYIVMPNHLHAIVILEKSKIDEINNMNGSHVETHGRASLQSIEQFREQSNQTGKQPFIRKQKSISSFIAGFKSSVNSKINNYIDKNNLDIPKYNRNNHFFQPNYHDHIIRNQNEYNRIAQYIIDNPTKWENDKLNGRNENIIMEPSAEYNSEIWMI